MDIKELVEEEGYILKRKASTHGGEYCSPCPFCKDGDDRFIVWPNRHNKSGGYQGGRYACRKCRNYGDAITFLRELHGLSYLEACASLKITPKEMRGRRRKKKKEYKPPMVPLPCQTWRDKAERFIGWCHAKLMSNRSAIDLITCRGLTLETVTRFQIGCNPGDRGKDIFREREDWGLESETKEDGKLKKLWLPLGIVIPSLSINGQPAKIKIRRTAWKEGDKLPKYVEVSGSQQCPSVYGDPDIGVALVLESELDAVLVQQEAGDLVYCIALGGSTKSLDLHTFGLLKNSPILFCPDYDEAGAVAWDKWKKLFPFAILALTPHEKAPGDAFLTGVNLRDWIKELIAVTNEAK